MSYDFQNKNMLIAGGTGFIGRRLVKQLSTLGVNVFVLTRNDRDNDGNITYLKGNLQDISSLEKYKSTKFDVCVYMAANIPEVGAKKETYLDAKNSTLDPLVNFCECFVNDIGKFVYISSIDVLGACEENYYDENVKPNVATPYGLAKYCGEFYAKAYSSQNSVPLTMLRFSQVYGPNEPIVRIIPIMKNALCQNKKFSIYSDGAEKRRFLFVDDAVEAIMCAIKSDKDGLFNIAGKEVCSILGLAHYMEKVFNKKMDLDILNKIVGKDNVPSIEKAEAELNFVPKYSMEDGLLKIKEEENA